MTAAELRDRWRADLESWAIPEEILAGAPESPWVLPRRLFARRAELRLESKPRRARRSSAPSRRSNAPGSVLDVGAGAGAACLPLVARATKITAVDSDPELLGVLDRYASGIGTDLVTGLRSLAGVAPDTRDRPTSSHAITCSTTSPTSCLSSRSSPLTPVAVVVAEMTARHPLTSLNLLWERFHGLVRPTCSDGRGHGRAVGGSRARPRPTRSGRPRPSSSTSPSRTSSR